MKSTTYSVFDEKVIEATNASVFIVRSFGQHIIQQLENFTFVRLGNVFVGRENFEELNEGMVFIERSFLDELSKICDMFTTIAFSLNFVTNFF
jgi:deoxyhypusine synthase